MGKNQKGGKKQKGYKNSDQPIIIKIDEIKPNNVDTFAGIITKNLGCKQFMVLNLETNVEMRAILPGSTRTRFNIGNYVMLQISTELTRSNAYILYQYNDDELSALKIKKVTQSIIEKRNEDAEEEDEFFDFDTI